jgi:hypothetical protein
MNGRARGCGGQISLAGSMILSHLLPILRRWLRRMMISAIKKMIRLAESI